MKLQFEREKALIDSTNQQNNDSLRKQLHQQAEIIGLANQLKHNSEKLSFLSTQ